MRGKKIRISKCISAHSSGKHWQNSVFESITEENKTKITKILSVIVAVLSKVPELVSRNTGKGSDSAKFTLIQNLTLFHCSRSKTHTFILECTNASVSFALVVYLCGIFKVILCCRLVVHFYTVSLRYLTKILEMLDQYCSLFWCRCMYLRII